MFQRSVERESQENTKREGKRKTNHLAELALMMRKMQSMWLVVRRGEGSYFAV